MRRFHQRWQPLMKWAVAFIVAAFCADIRAAVRMDVFIGYDGLASEGSWFPVVVEVENDGAGFQGTFELAPGQYSQGQTRTMALELPTRTVKRFILPVYAGNRYRSQWGARIYDEKGKVRAESLALQIRRQIQGSLPLVGAITRTAGGIPVLPEVKNKQQEWQPGVARLQPVLFPDTPLALQGLTTIYVNSEKALDLKVNQVNALLAWVAGGGHLVIGVEQVLHVNGNEWLKRLAPCDLTAIETVEKHSELQQWLTSNERYNGLNYAFSDSQSSTAAPADRNTRRRGQPRPTTVISTTFASPYARLNRDSAFEAAPLQVARGTLKDGKVLIGPEDSPLAISGRRGRGQVTFLMFSPELEPFVSWKNRPYFWAKMGDLPPVTLVNENYPRYSSYSLDGVFGAMVDSKQVRKLPVGWLLLLLIGYLAVIGPLDQYWLKKINRQMLTWVTFPIYVVCFSGLIYLIGYRLRAGESEWNELHVIDIFATGNQAQLRGWTFGSIYSPVNSRYKFAGDHPFAALRGEYLRNYYQGGQETSRGSVEQRGNSFAADVSVPVWTSQLLVSEWWRRGEPAIGFGITEDKSRRRVQDGVTEETSTRQVQITNTLNVPIKAAAVVIDGRVYDLGALKARETTTRSIPKESGETLQNFVSHWGYQFTQAAGTRHQAFGGNLIIADVPHSAMATSFASMLNAGQQQYQYGPESGFDSPAGFDLAELDRAGDAILLAFVEKYAPSKSMAQFSSRRGHRDTLFRITVPQ